MKNASMKNTLLRVSAFALMGVVATTILFDASTSYARLNERTQMDTANAPLGRDDLRSQIYSQPKRARTINPSDIAGRDYFNPNEVTVVGRKVDDLKDELYRLQDRISDLSERLNDIESDGQAKSATYFAALATINTQLQSGTTPGNPRLVARLSEARDSLEVLGGNVADLNDLAMEVSNTASMSSFLLESTRATYSLSGAVEEDHVRLAQLEDAVNNTVVLIDRMLNNVNDDITRNASYLSSERENLRTLSLAVTNGNLMGKNLSSRPFSSAKLSNVPGGPTPMAASPVAYTPSMPSAPQASGVPGGARPLVKIRFDRADVSFQQPVYRAVNEAMARYPNARFELVAVHPSKGNAAAVAIESTRARRNAEKVLRSLTEMGIALDRVDLSYSPSADATASEVHLYVR